MNGYGNQYGDQAAGQAQAQAQPYVQVVQQPNGFPHPVVSSFIPQFPQLASQVDSFARRFPWYLWLGIGLGMMWWLQKQGHWKKIAAKL